MEKGYIVGNNNVFNPKGELSRAAAVTIIDKMLEGFYNAAGTYSGKFEGNVLINSPDVILKDTQIDGNLIIAPGVAEGDVSLDNVSVTGDILVRGGGENSILFNRVSVNGTIIVEKVGDSVRIVVTGDSKINLVILESGAIVANDSEDLFDVEIPAEIVKGAKIELTGKFASVENNSEDTEIKVKGEIEKLELNKGAKITGDLKIKTLISAEGAKATINGKDYEGGQAGVAYDSNPPPPPSAGGGSTSGGSTGNQEPEKDTDPKPDPEPTPVPTPEPTPEPEENPHKVPDATSIKLEADKYSDSVIIPFTTTPASYITDMVVVLKEGKTANKNIQIKITEKSDLGNYIIVSSTTPSTVIFNNQAIAQDAIVIVTLNFMYEDLSFSKDVQVTIEAPIWGYSEYVDTRFAAGYPYAKVDPDTRDVKVCVNIIITDNDEHIVETDIKLMGAFDIGTYIVLQDKDKVSEKPTELFFVANPSTGNTYAPEPMRAYINDARNKIYIHYHRDLDIESVPSNSAFRIIGSESAIVEDVSVSNVESNHGLVILTVSGIGKDVDTSDLTFTYTPLEENKLKGKEGKTCSKGTGEIHEAGITIEDVVVSNDGRHIYISAQGGYNYWEEINWCDFTAEYGDVSIEYSYQDLTLPLSGSFVEFYLKANETDNIVIPPDTSATISITPKPVARDYAGDPLSLITLEGIMPLDSTPMFESAEYNGSELMVIIDGDVGNYSRLACNFTLYVNDEPCILRGFVYGEKSYDSKNNKLFLYFSKDQIPVTIDADDSITISYVHVHDIVDMWDMMYDPSGKSMEYFTKEQVKNMMVEEVLEP